MLCDKAVFVCWGCGFCESVLQRGTESGQLCRPRARGVTVCLLGLYVACVVICGSHCDGVLC